MKKLLLLLMALSPILVIAQTTNTYTVTGKVGNLNKPAMAYLIFRLGANQVADSAAIENGAFTMTGPMADPSLAQLVIDHKGVGLSKTNQQTADMITFWLDKTPNTITGTKDSVYSAQLTGSPLNSEGAELTKQLAGVEADAKKLKAEYDAASPEKQQSLAYKNEMKLRSKPLQLRQKTILTTFIKQHTNSFMSLVALNVLSSRSSDPDELLQLYNSLSQPLKDIETAKALKKSIDIAQVTSVGSIAPDFAQNDMNGNPIKLSSFRGKYVLLDFWASWCPPCREESPNLVNAYNKYKSKNFTILGVSLDKPAERSSWLDAIKTDGMLWTQVSDLKYWSNEAARLYYIGSVPSNFLIDPNGKIVARDLRGPDLGAKLEELLGAK